jgi:hypothetical protein
VREQLGCQYGRRQVDLSPRTDDLGNVRPGTAPRFGGGKRETRDAVPGNDCLNGLIGVSLGVDQSAVEIKEQGTYASAMSHFTYFARSAGKPGHCPVSKYRDACCDVR